MVNIKRIKRGDLLPWFLEDHAKLPQWYLEDCKEFFDKYIGKRVRENMGLKPGEVDNDQ